MGRWWASWGLSVWEHCNFEKIQIERLETFLFFQVFAHTCPPILGASTYLPLQHRPGTVPALRCNWGQSTTVPPARAHTLLSCETQRASVTQADPGAHLLVVLLNVVQWMMWFPFSPRGNSLARPTHLFHSICRPVCGDFRVHLVPFDALGRCELLTLKILMLTLLNRWQSSEELSNF